MFIIRHILESIAFLFSTVFFILYVLLIVRIILAWVSVSSNSELVDMVHRITEPLLRPFRRLPLRAGGIDFSPILAFIVLSVLGRLIIGIVREAASRF